jgi:hypothetical protein
MTPGFAIADTWICQDADTWFRRCLTGALLTVNVAAAPAQAVATPGGAAQASVPGFVTTAGR